MRRGWGLYLVLITNIVAGAGSTIEDHCVAGDMAACYRTGKAYRVGGEGFPKDRQIARDYLRLACDGGVMEACQDLETFDAPVRHNEPVVETRKPGRNASLVDIPPQGYRWRHFIIPKLEGWYLNRKKSNDEMLILQTQSPNVDVVALKKDIFRLDRRYRKELLRQLLESFRKDPDYQHVRVHAHSGIRVLSDPSASELSADSDGLRVHAFFPYHRGRFYFVTALNKLPRRSLSREQKRMLGAIRIGGSR